MFPGKENVYSRPASYKRSFARDWPQVRMCREHVDNSRSSAKRVAESQRNEGSWRAENISFYIRRPAIWIKSGSCRSVSQTDTRKWLESPENRTFSGHIIQKINAA